MSILNDVLVDLVDESTQLERWVSDLSADAWSTRTTPEGWTVAHQIAHLHWTDQACVLAATDEAGFAAQIEEAAANPTGFVDAAADQLAQLEHTELLRRWREGKAALVDALQAVSSGRKIPWYGPPMSPTSMATARIMETWAHGHDVAEALGITVEPTDRVKHVCHLGVRTRNFAYLMRGGTAPDAEVFVRLAAPSGADWTWGDAGAEQSVVGSAWDFALLATRRRHRDDVGIRATGADADHWLDIIQAFAGPPGNDPRPLAQRGSW